MRTAAPAPPGAAPDPIPGPRRGATEFATDDPERAHAFLRATYVDHTMRIQGDQDRFRMRHTDHDVGEFSIATLTHTMAVEHNNRPLGFLLVGRILGGRLERTGAGGETRLAPADVFVFGSPDEAFDVRWDSIEMELTRIDLSALDRLGAASTPRFTDVRPASPAAAARLTRTLAWAGEELLTNPEAVAQPLITGSAARVLAATTLATFPHLPLFGTTPASDAARPAVLRRALEFIDGHAHLDISLSDIADAARVSPRSLQYAFRQHHGTTPSAHLRRVRLDRAHLELRAADPTGGTTVAAVAYRWGFLSIGRFTRTHLEAYGSSPRETLAR
ncbi:MAG TPA: AraC family transcriptional regulator [Pseudonocardia sp.]